MSWNTFLSLIFIFDSIEKTHDFIRTINTFPDTLIERINKDIFEEVKYENR